MVVSSATASDPWPFLGVALAVIAGVGVAWTRWNLRADRWRAASTGTWSLPPWEGDSTEHILELPRVDRSRVDRLARTALAAAGATAISEEAGRGAIGWVNPLPYLGRLQLQERRLGFELGVAALSDDPPGITRVVCAARPQMSNAVVGARRGAELLQRLVAEVALAADESG